jgi:hypothetical protein
MRAWVRHQLDRCVTAVVCLIARRPGSCGGAYICGRAVSYTMRRGSTSSLGDRSTPLYSILRERRRLGVFPLSRTGTNRGLNFEREKRENQSCGFQPHREREAEKSCGNQGQGSREAHEKNVNFSRLPKLAAFPLGCAATCARATNRMSGQPAAWVCAKAKRACPPSLLC